MDTIALKTISRLRGLSQSDLARMAGVSRQAVSAWLAKGRMGKGSVPVRSTSVLKLAQGLHINPGDLLEPLFKSQELEEFRGLEAALLWDRLYPSLGEFGVALARNHSRAIARLVQVFGFYHAEKIVGRVVWTKFSDYKKYIHPVRRAECERLWTLIPDLESN